MRYYPSVGVMAADILLPNSGIDYHKWASIACDQFTSQPEYWEKAEEIVGDSPSTLHMILPEVYLGKPQEAERVKNAQQTMRHYLDSGVFICETGLILVERTIHGKTRRGLMMAIDLERYDFNKGSQSLVRATEGTILDRLPPRMRIREGAAVELPHILILIDDPDRTVIEPIQRQADSLPVLYDFDLMQGSGHVRGSLVNNPDAEKQVIAALEHLASPEVFYPKYNVGKDKGILLFAVGDGNHSLATAKAIWEKNKANVGMNHPSRYALVEIENVHDTGLDFEPIHRVLFGLTQPIKDALTTHFQKRISFKPCQSMQEMTTAVAKSDSQLQNIGLITPQGFELVQITEPESNLAVGTLQSFIDEAKQAGLFESIDYVHGEEVLARLAGQTGNCGFYLPAMQKSELFKTVILDGALPRKTFSMGEAEEKRFYIEARKII